MRIDAHHHFWRFSAAEYGWIDEGMKAIRRDFLPADLEAEARKAGVDGVVSVQARTTLEETHWLLGLAKKHPLIRGVVGWVPLAESSIDSILETLLPEAALKSVRHILQAEPDAFFESPDFNRGLTRLSRTRLAYDLLIVERQLEAALRLVDRHPNLVFILDHIAKPRIKDGALEPWASRMRELAKRPHVWCKLSGMVTEADFTRWTPESLAPYFDAALEAFGPGRLMFGSDWPVCTVACPYGRWAQVVDHAISKLSPAEQGAIRGANAVRAYKL